MIRIFETRRSVLRGAVLAAVLAAVLLQPACVRRAPWPDECVAFAEMTFGYDLETPAAYPVQKEVFDRLVTTCLTAPFDRRVFACAQESRAPMECLRRFQPELFGDTEMVPVLPQNWRDRGYLPSLR